MVIKHAKPIYYCLTPLQKATAEAIIRMLFITRTILISMTLSSFIPSFSKNN